jgi:hypothetical protein
MSQRAVEGTLGRLITDSEFRDAFYADPAATCVRESLDLTTRELEALMALGPSHLETFGRAVDSRIIRAAVGGTNSWAEWRTGSRGSGGRAKSIPAPPQHSRARAAK